ncbi:MAG: hypothetical protein WCE61_15070 [Candidatus Acidiferrum sp.]
MLRHLSPAFLLLVSAPLVCARQSQPAASPPAAAAAAKSAAAKTQPAGKNSEKPKRKTKKVWTDDDITKIGGGISVVGDSSSSSAERTSTAFDQEGPRRSGQKHQIERYRSEIRQLQAQLDATDKKIDDLRNFKGENASASGGINPSHGYSMTPVADQIKQLEAKKKQIQDKIDAVTDEARKQGIEPGQLR